MYKYSCRLLSGVALIAVICLTGVSCHTESNSISIIGDTIDMQCASLLSITECDGYTVADIKNPWNGSLMHRYILVDKNSDIPPQLPDGTLLRTPLNRQLIFSTIHTQLINDLGCVDAIAGVCDARYITLPHIVKGIEKGEITNCGSSLDIDIERVVQLSPEAVWVLPHENGGYGKLEKLEYPLIECVEYMETSPLGGAEWMRFYGRLLGCAHRADSLFATIYNNYRTLCDKVSLHAKHRPTLLCELKSSSAWYMPGGGSTMGRLYSDAGAEYLFSEYGKNGSVPLSYETVLDCAADADVWLIKYGSENDMTYSSMLADFEGYGHFKAFKNKNIYACNVSRKPFYEETPFRPDILLHELVSVFHPYIIENISLRYYEKLQE